MTGMQVNFDVKGFIEVSLQEVYNHMQDWIGIILSGLYRVVQTGLNLMRDVTKEYIEEPTLHFNNMMKKFS